MTAWNDFVKKIYHEGHDKNPNYSFKQAMKDAHSTYIKKGKEGGGTRRKKRTRRTRRR